MSKCIILTILFSLVLAHNCIAEKEVKLGLEAGSAHVWRGITVIDGITITPSSEIIMDGFGLVTRGSIDVENYRDTDDEGLFLEGDVELYYKFVLDSIHCKAGYQEFLKGKRNNARNELFASVGMYFAENLMGRFNLFYEVAELEDFYGQFQLLYDFNIGDAFDGELIGSIGAAGEKVSLGEDAGLHDFLLGLEVTHGRHSSLELGGKLAYTGNIDDDVLPDQPVDFLVSFFAVHRF
jgi:hypothetical protein